MNPVCFDEYLFIFVSVCVNLINTQSWTPYSKTMDINLELPTHFVAMTTCALLGRLPDRFWSVWGNLRPPSPSISKVRHWYCTRTPGLERCPTGLRSGFFSHLKATVFLFNNNNRLVARQWLSPILDCIFLSVESHHSECCVFQNVFGEKTPSHFNLRWRILQKPQSPPYLVNFKVISFLLDHSYLYSLANTEADNDNVSWSLIFC